MTAHRDLLGALCGYLVLAAIGNLNAATIWSEAGDAGDSLASANVTTGAGNLEAIVGTLPDTDPNNVDIFKLSISDLAQFSATTDNFPSTDILDTWLYLFDSGGNGVAASGSSVGGSTNATIPAGSISGPAGSYYLAVSRLLSVPLSPTGAIFPDLVANSPNGEVLGPTGPGGSSPLSGWSAPSLLDFDNYRIDLSGAKPVPEPSTGIVWALAALLGAMLRRRALA